ncbi:Outer membrane protein assembly factor BamB precursor [Paraliobacillus sp. PM-2]|uniref:outer membrane protein assembly factor BamB family protein n=1 Tax=Paraliobacillus sp. PM-2 TaxID=1462524 RepID=UPI00061C6D28|nr:PQQ-binding-like beta-propeller repeat protein [Paraliobacillus sp. PM-2]CQR46204.1 Outer membrane protein assembly factor BamB precursor [Paraliobacillus sp. PM-2]
MKKIIVISSSILLVAAIGIAISLTNNNSFGPEEWTQYRMKSDKNAVYDNGGKPLEMDTFQTTWQVRATPVVAGDRMFVGNHGTGDLHAFNIKTGEKIWQSQAPNWVHSEMVFSNDVVYVGFGNRFFQDGVRGTKESGVLALDAATGEKLWKYNTEGEVMPTPVIYNENIYVATGDRHLYKIDKESGNLTERTFLGAITSMSSPNLTEDVLYMGGSSDYTFTAFDLQEDAIKWQTDFPDVVAGLDDVPPAVSDGIVVTTAIEGSYDDPNHMMYAMDTNSGDIIWETSLGEGEMVSNNKSGAPIIHKGNIYVGSPITKTFYAYDLATGEKVWEFEDEIMKGPPVAKDGVVYFGNKNGVMHALDTTTGDLIKQIELDGALAPSGPIIMNDTLIVGSQDHQVYAVPLADFTGE